jgi:hypothetical protein
VVLWIIIRRAGSLIRDPALTVVDLEGPMALPRTHAGQSCMVEAAVRLCAFHCISAPCTFQGVCGDIGNGPLHDLQAPARGGTEQSQSGATC